MSSSLSDPSFSFFQSKTTSSSLRVYPDLTRVYPKPDHLHRLDDHFDRLPDSLFLLVFNKIGDVKALGRFHSLVPQVENVVTRRFLKNFNEIRFLWIELPSGELSIDDGVLLKWRADFVSTLDNYIILGASSVIQPGPNKPSISNDVVSGDCATNLIRSDPPHSDPIHPCQLQLRSDPPYRLRSDPLQSAPANSDPLQRMCRFWNRGTA